MQEYIFDNFSRSLSALHQEFCQCDSLTFCKKASLSLTFVNVKWPQPLESVTSSSPWPRFALFTSTSKSFPPWNLPCPVLCWGYDPALTYCLISSILNLSTYQWRSDLGLAQILWPPSRYQNGLQCNATKSEEEPLLAEKRAGHGKEMLSLIFILLLRLLLKSQHKYVNGSWLGDIYCCSIWLLLLDQVEGWKWTLPQIKLGPNPGDRRAGDLSGGNLGGSGGIRRFSRPHLPPQIPGLASQTLGSPQISLKQAIMAPP